MERLRKIINIAVYTLTFIVVGMALYGILGVFFIMDNASGINPDSFIVKSIPFCFRWGFFGSIIMAAFLLFALKMEVAEKDKDLFINHVKKDV